METIQQERGTQILRMPEVMKKIGVSRSTVYRLMADENFPRQVKIGKRAKGWRLDAVERWIDTRDLNDRHAA